MFFTHQNNKNNFINYCILIYSKQTKNEYIIMQLAVIDDLIQESKSQIEQSEPCTQLERITKTLYVSGFVDCAFQAELISKADYEDFKAQINDLRMG